MSEWSNSIAISAILRSFPTTLIRESTLLDASLTLVRQRQKFFFRHFFHLHIWYFLHSLCCLCLLQTVEHGFPHQPSSLAFDPKLQIMAIGTKSGAIKVYPFIITELMPLTEGGFRRSLGQDHCGYYLKHLLLAWFLQGIVVVLSACTVGWDSTAVYIIWATPCLQKKHLRSCLS